MEKNLSRVRVNCEKIEKYGIATGIATCTFSILGKKNGWLNNEQSRKIGLSGLGITCIFSIPLIARELNEKKISDVFFNTAKSALALRNN